MRNKIITIVGAGGPGGGKTSGENSIKKELEKLGFEVIFPGETATEVINEGIKPFGPDAIDVYEFQKIVFKRQLEKEEKALEYARKQTKPVAIIYDRGLMDGKAYTPKEQWPLLLKEFNLTEQEIMARYDLVTFYTSTAVDRPDIYEQIKANNPARSENVEQAAEKDRISLDCYVSHPNLHIIDNSTNFQEKIKRVVECILIYLNIPFHYNNQYKYLVDLNNSSLSTLESISTKAYLEQTYLDGPTDLDIKVRKSTIDGNDTYYLIIKRKEGTKEEIIENRVITKEEYHSYLTQQDKKLETIVKTRYSFIYNNEKWNLDIFPDSTAAILENQTTANIANLKLPAFLNILGERNDIRNKGIATNGLTLTINKTNIPTIPDTSTYSKVLIPAVS